MNARSVCFFCVTKIWQLSAIILVLLAVLVSLLKYSLPYANDYRVQVEQFLGEQLNADISIGSLSASWQGNGPALVVNEVGFADNADAPISVSVAQTRLHINLWQSLLHQQLRSNYFVLHGFKAKIDARQLFTNEKSSNNSQQQALIESLFLGASGHFAIEESELSIISLDNSSHRILLENLVWENRIDGHYAEGQVSLPGIEQNSLEARLKISGDTLAGVYGDLYVQAQGLDVSGWLNEYLRPELKELQSDLNIESWLHFAGGRLTDVQVLTHPSKLSWRNGEQAEYLELQQGMVRIHPQAKGWRVRTSGLQLSDEQFQWSPLIFDGLFSDEQQVWVQDLDISMVSTFARLAKGEALQGLFSIQPQGFINEGYFHWQNADKWRLWFAAEHLGWSGIHGIPGAQDLSATAHITNEKGLLSVQGSDNHLLTGDTFSQPLAYQQLVAEIAFYNHGDYWSIESDNVRLSNDDLQLVSEFALRLEAQPNLDLYAEISGGSAASAGAYFPVPYMHKNLIDYLNGAIKGGEMRFAQVLMQGPIAEFPYTENQGRFVVKAEVDNAKFAFAPQWPALDEIGVSLNFDNQRMDIYSREGELLNLSLGSSVHVYLEDLLNADTLFIDIDEQVDAPELQPFFADTPLAKPLATVFDVIQAKGSISGKLQLQIDLKDGGVLAKGDVEFAGNPVYLAQPGLNLEGLRGRLSFANDHIEIKEASASWQGMPLTISLLGAQEGDSYNTNIELSLEADTAKLEQHLNGLLAPQLQGKTPLNAQLQLRFGAQGFNYEAHVQSDLIGISSSLPVPYNKQAQEVLPLNVLIQGDDISNLIMAELDGQLYFNGILENGNGQMSSAHLVVGEHNLGLNQQGFDVSVNLPKADVLAWQPVIDNIISVSSRPASGASVMPKFNKVVGQIGQAQLGPVPFNELEFTLTPTPGAMDLKLNAKELRARVDIPTGEQQRDIHIQADYLRVNVHTEQKPQSELENALAEQALELTEEDLSWLARLPAVRFDCDDCRLNQYQLDKVSMAFEGDGQQLNIKSIVIDKGEHILRADGIWRDGQTALQGEFKSDDIGELFDEFDITSTVQDSNASMDFALHWQGAPYNFDIASLGGNIEWGLGEGHLSEISDGGARVFSLLSLDSLVRKLKLDFRDVFAKGFFYNSMEGSMQLASGIAYTKDTRMDGVPADLSIQGYADLNNQTLNYDLSVAPQVTSSLPVIVAWMVNPVTGLAALALDKVIHSARVISEIKFKIRGPMSDPEVIELDRKSREVTLPQAAQNEPPQEGDLEPQPQ
ncbi:YhdP family protein [Pseudoalteromonas sp. YIC-827]|uniref:YhdP family protein n=1 Tax=Pseudoalteromonas qingdaonensis TaxID=3131913 RepID=A0ABU9MXQ2_9GAMM